jgi:hypothetical protein
MLRPRQGLRRGSMVEIGMYYCKDVGNQACCSGLASMGCPKDLVDNAGINYHGRRVKNILRLIFAKPLV